MAEFLPGAIRLVFLNGGFVPELSRTGKLPAGVVVGNLASVLDSPVEQLRSYLGRLADFHDQVFPAWNTAFLRDGALVLLPRNCVLAEPIQLLFASVPQGKSNVSHPRVLIVAQSSSQAAVIERYLSPGAESEVYFSNAVTEIALEENASLEHYKLQQESREAFHIAHTQVRQARGSNFCSSYIGLGGRLVRNEIRILFGAEGSEATLNGLYLGAGRQHLDNHTVIDHARPHCTSHQLYKGILTDRAHGVFNGKVIVRQDAQKTDAKQTNKVLLLSEEATINTKPQLEIFADDVKCTHGATVGQLDAEAVFYLQSRGLGLEEARNLLTFAFANDIVDRIRLEGIRRHLENLLTSRSLTAGPLAPGAL